MNFQAIFEATPGLYLILDRDLQIVAANDAYLAATLTRREDIVDRHVFEVFPDNPEVPSATGTQNLRRSLEAVREFGVPDTMALQRYDIRRPEGGFEQRYWSPKNLPVFGEDGELVYIIHRVEDVTEFVRLQQRDDSLQTDVTGMEAELFERSQEIHQKNLRLESVLSQLAEQEKKLRELFAEARQEGRSKDRFLAMLGHELRNPLAAISMAAAVLPVSAEAEDAEDASARKIICRQVHQLNKLVDELLDVARINADRIDLEQRDIGLQDVVEAALDTARPRVGARGQGLHVDLPGEAIRVHADATRMSQVLANLLSNASKYTSQGGNVWLSARVDAEEDEAVIEVRDDGHGIPDDLMPHIFTMFVQGDGSIDRVDPGLGLGLTLAKRLVEMHGGTITAASEGSGRGSTFTVRLPLAAGDDRGVEEEAGPQRQAPGAVPSGTRVLIVDDNQDAAHMLDMLLRRAGHEVCVAYDGASGLDLVTSFEPRVVLLDIGLPGMNGFEVAARVRALQDSSVARIIAVTGFGSPALVERGHRGDFDHYLVKPVEPKLLLDLIDEAT